MAETITNAGAALLARHQGNGTHLNIDQFVLAHIPGQNPADDIDKDRGLPPSNQIVHDQLIPEEHKGYMAPNMVSYSLFMGEQVGPFVFNTIYSVATGENDAVIKIVTLPDTHKIAEDIGDGVRGQAMVRNLVLEYSNASGITGITVEAEAWQFDFENATETKAGMAEIATQEETDEGEDSQRFITPKTLSRRLSDLNSKHLLEKWAFTLSGGKTTSFNLASFNEIANLADIKEKLLITGWTRPLHSNGIAENRWGRVNWATSRSDDLGVHAGANFYIESNYLTVRLSEQGELFSGTELTNQFGGTSEFEVYIWLLK